MEEIAIRIRRTLKDALMETGKSASMKELLSANQRIHELESELHDLKKKLERTESRHSHGPESAEGLTRVPAGEGAI